MKPSLRVRLVVGIVALMAFGLAIADVAAVVLLRSYLIGRVDEQLAAPLNRPAQPDNALPNPCTVEQSDGQEAQQLPTDFVLLVFDETGHQSCRLPRAVANEDTPNPSALTTADLAAAAQSGQVIAVPGTGNGAVWRVRVATSDSGFVATGISTSQVEATVNQLAQVTVSTSLGILALGATGGFLLVRLGLRPLSDIETTAEAIAHGDISRRVDEAPPNTEMGRLSGALNTMLTRIEHEMTARVDSEQRLRRFVADASHELRTPITTIRGYAELYRQGAATETDVDSLLARIEAESTRMGALVDDLLLLARMDAAPELEQTDVDLLSIAALAVADARVHEPTRALSLKARTNAPWADEPPVVRGDPARLHQVLANLISNALRHTPTGTPIRVELGVRDGQVRCLVIDQGTTLPPEATSRLFERFYRGDASRTRQTGGTGLGLAIVASLVAAHRGKVWWEPTPGGGNTFAVSLPVHSA